MPRGDVEVRIRPVRRGDAPRVDSRRPVLRVPLLERRLVLGERDRRLPRCGPSSTRRPWRRWGSTATATSSAGPSTTTSATAPAGALTTTWSRSSERSRSRATASRWCPTGTRAWPSSASTWGCPLPRLGALLGERRPHQARPARYTRWRASGSSVRPDRAVHVGDHYYADVLGARSVGIHPVMIDRFGFGHPADVPVIKSLYELLPILGLEGQAT